VASERACDAIEFGGLHRGLVWNCRSVRSHGKDAPGGVHQPGARRINRRAELEDILDSGVIEHPLFSADSLAVQKHVQSVLHGTGRNNLAGIDEENFVGVGDGIEAMRDNDLCRRRRQLVEDLF
jgi:hypothetical protein